MSDTNLHSPKKSGGSARLVPLLVTGIGGVFAGLLLAYAARAPAAT